MLFLAATCLSSCPAVLVFEPGITIIEDEKYFNCANLVGELIIPDTVERIGKYAFSGCRGFTGKC